jgi:hypothetical protein
LKIWQENFIKKSGEYPRDWKNSFDKKISRDLDLPLSGRFKIKISSKSATSKNPTI